MCYSALRLIDNKLMSLKLIPVFLAMAHSARVLFCCSIAQWQYQEALALARDLNQDSVTIAATQNLNLSADFKHLLMAPVDADYRYDGDQRIISG